MTQALGFWTQAAPATATTADFKVVQERAVKFAKQNAGGGQRSRPTRYKLSRLLMEASQSVQQK